jgi:hypothetical protein
MPHPCPHHCPPERGRGAAVLAALAVLAVIVAATARPVVHAAEDVLEVAAITAAVLVVGLVAVVVVWRARRRPHALPVACQAPQALPAAERPVSALPVPTWAARPRELESGAAVHLHFHGMTTADIAAIIAAQNDDRADTER